MSPVPARRDESLPADYPRFLGEIKDAVVAARAQAALAVSAITLAAYWDDWLRDSRSRRREGWGAKIVERLASDLRREFPDMKGLSVRNLRYMRRFAQAWPAQSASEIVAAGCWHNCRGVITCCSWTS